MSGENPVSVDVYILDKVFKVACPLDQRDELLASARLLSDRMRDIKSAGKMMSMDRVAIMAGLNIAHELVRVRQGSSPQDPDVELRLSLLADRVSEVLDETLNNAE
jgi:cell division protein ZapA